MHAQEVPQLLQFDPGIGLWTLLCFVLLLILLKRFAWKPLLTAVDERESRLRQSLEDAQKLNEETKLQGERQAALLAQAHAQAAVVLADAHDQAIALKEQLMLAAAQEKQRLLDNASAEIARQSEAAKEELKAFSARLALDTAEKILLDQLDKPKAEAMTDRLIKELR